MPLYLKEVDIVSEVARFRSALIVPCRLCPAVSLAVRSKQPFIKLFCGNLKTPCYEDRIKSIKSRLEEQGIRTDVFKSSVLNYAHCMWTPKKRNQLLKRASEYEAVVVLGCEAAVQTIHDSLESSSCRIFQGMRSEGIMTVKPSFQFPGNISLELDKIIPLVHPERDSLPWICL